MSKNKKIILGFLAFVPLVIEIVMIILIMKNFVGLFGLAMADASGEEAGNLILGDYTIIVILGVISSVLTLAEKICFIVMTVKNKSLNDTSRLLYIIFLIFFTIITAIVYYFLEVLKEEEEIS